LEKSINLSKTSPQDTDLMYRTSDVMHLLTKSKEHVVLFSIGAKLHAERVGKKKTWLITPTL